MSNLNVDGRTLTEAERIKLMADMEREETASVPLDKYERLITLGRRLKAISKQIHELEVDYGNTKGEFDALAAEVAG